MTYIIKNSNGEQLFFTHKPLYEIGDKVLLAANIIGEVIDIKKRNSDLSVPVYIVRSPLFMHINSSRTHLVNWPFAEGQIVRKVINE